MNPSPRQICLTGNGEPHPLFGTYSQTLELNQNNNLGTDQPILLPHPNPLQNNANEWNDILAKSSSIYYNNPSLLNFHHKIFPCNVMFSARLSELPMNVPDWYSPTQPNQNPRLGNL